MYLLSESILAVRCPRSLLLLVLSLLPSAVCCSLCSPLLMCCGIAEIKICAIQQSSVDTNANDYKCCPVCVALDYSQLQSPACSGSGFGSASILQDASDIAREGSSEREREREGSVKGQRTAPRDRVQLLPKLSSSELGLLRGDGLRGRRH